MIDVPHQGIGFFFLNDNFISWSSRQWVVSRFSTESEYCSLVNAIANLDLVTIAKTWSFSFKGCDNINAPMLTTNPIFHACTY